MARARTNKVNTILLRARQFEFRFPRPTLVMGVLNVTPDSFSDGGKYFDQNRAVEHALQLVAEGSDIVDVGGESTRPRAEQVSEQEELRRVIPVIRQLAGQVKIPISIDTMKPSVARAAIEAGASIINDVAANRGDESMWRLAAESKAAYVCMHMQGSPQTMQNDPNYGDVVAEVGTFFLDRMARLEQFGVLREQVIFDPGIGFGKTVEHNLQLLGSLGRITRVDRPLLIGVSRKSFIGKVIGSGNGAILSGGLACATLGVEARVQIVRTHDVLETVQALRMAEAILNTRK